MSELLWDALQRPAVVALVGGGGKTTLALRLLGEASGVSKALFTTTTRIRVPQAGVFVGKWRKTGIPFKASNHTCCGLVVIGIHYTPAASP